MTNCERYKYRLDWNGVTVEISYEPCWLNTQEIYGTTLAHIEVRSLAPERAALPITETGYRSHFVGNAEIIEAGGASAYVRAWLEDAALAPAWKAAQEAARQLALF